MSKRDITMIVMGMLCGGIVVGIGALTMSPLLNIVLVATNSDSPQQPRGASSRYSTEKVSYALDGFCPVTLKEKWQWALGNTQYHERRGNQVFLFAGSAEQEQFQEDPDRFLPAFSGNDVVLAKENGETARGICKHGIMHEDRIYLFANEESLQRFSRDPALYVTAKGDDPFDGDTEAAVSSDARGCRGKSLFSRSETENSVIVVAW